MSLRSIAGALALAAVAFGLSAPAASAQVVGPGQVCLDYVAPPDPPTWLEPSARVNAISLRWTPPPFTPGQCNPEKEPLGYRLTFNGQSIDLPNANGYTAFGLTSGTSYEFKLQTIGRYELSESIVITARTLQACPPVILPPNSPGTVALSDADVTSTSATLRWTPAPYTPDGCNGSQEPTGYRVVYPNNGSTAGMVVNLPADATSHLVEGLTPATAYGFKVYTLGSSTGIDSSPLEINLTTDAGDGGTASLSYALTGSTTINTITRGTLPLKGSVAATLNGSTGAFTADLSLAQTSGRLVAGGLPVTAKIGFVPSGKTTGTLEGGVLTTNSKVRIKVQEVKLFGAIPLAGGNSCQTKQLSDITLKSTSFNPAAGGTLTGTYKISDLNGCGVLNGLVSPLTAGGGNTITVKLAPVPAPAAS